MPWDYLESGPSFWYNHQEIDNELDHQKSPANPPTSFQKSKPTNPYQKFLKFQRFINKRQSNMFENFHKKKCINIPKLFIFESYFIFLCYFNVSYFCFAFLVVVSCWKWEILWIFVWVLDCWVVWNKFGARSFFWGW